MNKWRDVKVMICLATIVGSDIELGRQLQTYSMSPISQPRFLGLFRPIAAIGPPSWGLTAKKLGALGTLQPVT